MAKANAQIEVSAGTSRLASGLRVAYGQFKAFGTSVAAGIGSALKKINFKPGDTMKNAIGHAGGDLIGKGMGAITDAAGEVRDFERNLVRFDIASDHAAGSSGELRKKMGDISAATGVARAEVLAGAQAYVGFTGDAKGAAKAAEVFARVAAASGASTQDVAQAQSALKTSMGITADEAEAAFSAMIVQGKGGAVELKDMAGELAGLAPRFALFKGGKGLSGLRELGAGFQIIMRNSATASDAATKYEALMGALSDKQTLGRLKGIGVQVVDNKGKLLGASQVFENIAKSQKLFSGTNLSNVFGRKEAQMAALALHGVDDEGKKNIDTYHDLRDAAKDTGAVQRDMNSFLESDAGRLDKAMNNLKLAIANAFTPERIAGFTRAVEQLVEKLGPLVDLIGKGADLLGGIAGVGKSIRGLFSDNGNPYASDAMAHRRDRDIASTGWDNDQKRRATPEEIKAAQERMSRANGYDRTVSDILGGEKNERSSPESIRRAVMARFSDNEGTATAGNRYLANAVDGGGQGVADTVDKVVKESLNSIPFAELGRGIVEGLMAKMPAPTVQIGDNQVARANDKSTHAQRATK